MNKINERFEETWNAYGPGENAFEDNFGFDPDVNGLKKNSEMFYTDGWEDGVAEYECDKTHKAEVMEQELKEFRKAVKGFASTGLTVVDTGWIVRSIEKVLNATEKVWDD